MIPWLLSGLLFRLIVWTWPLWLWFLARLAGGMLFSGTGLADAGAVLGPAILFLFVALLQSQALVPSQTALWAALGSIISGFLGITGAYEAAAAQYPAAVFGAMAPFMAINRVVFLSSLGAVIVPITIVVRSRMLPMFGGAGANSSGAHGTARWMTMPEARRTLNDGNLVIGEAYTPSKQPRLAGKAPLLRFDGRGHLLTVAGAGSGKTVSVAIPNCLFWEGGLVVHDPKGELAEICQTTRRKKGRNVIVLNPSEADTDSYNVLDRLDAHSENLAEEARMVVSWLSSGEPPKGDNAYFEIAAENLLTALILDVVCDDEIPSEQKTLLTVRERISSPYLVDILKIIAGKDPSFSFGTAQQLAGELARVGENAEKQWTGVQAHASSMTSWLSSPRLGKLVSGLSGRRLTTDEFLQGNSDVFVCVPLKILEATPAIARVLLGALLNATYEGGVKSTKTLFLLDEMPRLGYMKILETARDAGRGLGITLWAIVQDLGQLKARYDEEGLQGWMANAEIKTFFGINDPETAELVSKYMDESTISVEAVGVAYGQGGGAVGSRHDNVNRNVSLTGRRLMTPGEVMNMAVDERGIPDEQIVLVRNRPPLKCGMSKYYRRQEFASAASQ